MDNLELIKNIRKNLPENIAIIGYGSGIFKQQGYDRNEIPDKDIILVVENFRQFLIDDYKMNKDHFSSDFDVRVLEDKKDKYKFYKNIGCLKFYHDNVHYKMMIISESALIYDLKTWNHFGMAGRLTKPILYEDLKANLENLILKNRENILITALLFSKDNYMKKEDLYKIISKLTYMYDFRTILPGERKSKSEDIVNGAVEKFDEIYLQSPLITTKGSMVINPHPIELIEELPVNLKKHIYARIKQNQIEKSSSINEISKAIETYFMKTNFTNSIRLAISSSATLGPKETIKHGIAKFQKHLKK